MQPELERSDQVVARVVAWHNRHPLATPITADQVHSVGVVSLPFAVRGAEVQAVPTPAPEAAPPAPATDPTPDPTPEAPVELAIETDDGDAAAADGPDLSQAALAEPADGAPVDAPPMPILQAVEMPATPASLPLLPAPIRSTLPARPRSMHPLTWWRRWRGNDGFHALFSEDFIAPLRPRRIARWAAAHGVGHPPLPADAPRRVVGLDPQRRLQDDAAAEVELHLITAAIGIGDQRRRLLLAPGPAGVILGPRHWSRPRMATASALLLALLLPLGAMRWQRGGTDAPRVAAAASAASSAVAVASAPAVAAGPNEAAASAGVDGVAAAMTAASAPVAVTSEPAADMAAPAQAPPDVAARPGRIALDPLVPRLVDAQREDLRRTGRDLRGEPAAPVEAKAWALVTAPLDQRRAERAAAQLQAVALFQALPMRVEQWPTGKRWRAVFWPFTSAQDAEKVRLALADKGLQTEVLEF